MIRKNRLKFFDRRKPKPNVSPENTLPAAIPVVQAGPCCLCNATGETTEERVTLQQYGSRQNDLLVRHLVTTLPGIDTAGSFCVECLEKAERELHARQLHRINNESLFVDLELGDHPILPTPGRMSANSYYRGRGVTIALVDSGFYPHDDLVYPANRILAMYDAVRGRMMKQAGRLRNQSPPIEAWHGTMTAAVAAGNGNLSRGYYRGIASEANLVLIKTMTPKYRIQTPQVVRALEWILAHYRQYGIRIVNLSLGVDETTDSLDHPVVALVEELVARGVVVVAASGNNPFQPLKPPGWAPSAITVGGYNDNNSTEWMRRELWHSSYGSTHGGARKPELLAPAIWLAAPILPNTGVKREAEALFLLARAPESQVMSMVEHLADHTGIAAALRAARTPLRVHSAVFRRIHDEKLINTSYKHVDGTSFAAPIISSIIAQMLEARPKLTPAEVKEILTSSAMLLPNAPAEAQGFGIVQADMALDVTLALTPGAPPRTCMSKTRCE